MAMAEAEQYDVVVIGSGEGGKYLAWHLAQTGRRTAVVERRWIGGSCPNINCLPSKNEIWSAGVAKIVARAGEFGVMVGLGSVDMKKVVQRKRDMVDGLIAFHLERYEASGAELIMGNARIIAPRTVEVALNKGGTRRLDMPIADRNMLRKLDGYSSHHELAGSMGRRANLYDSAKAGRRVSYIAALRALRRCRIITEVELCS
jgi:Pyridine nucleotide-disulphide oxidoreductase